MISNIKDIIFKRLFNMNKNERLSSKEQEELIKAIFEKIREN